MWCKSFDVDINFSESCSGWSWDQTRWVLLNDEDYCPIATLCSVWCGGCSLITPHMIPQEWRSRSLEPPVGGGGAESAGVNPAALQVRGRGWKMSKVFLWSKCRLICLGLYFSESCSGWRWAETRRGVLLNDEDYCPIATLCSVWCGGCSLITPHMITQEWRSRYLEAYRWMLWRRRGWISCASKGTRLENVTKYFFEVNVG